MLIIKFAPGNAKGIYAGVPENEFRSSTQSEALPGKAAKCPWKHHLVNEMLHRAQMECSAADRIPKVGSENFQFKTVVKNQGLCALLEIQQ